MADSIYHATRLTGIKPGECTVLVRDGGEAFYHIGGRCELNHFGGGPVLPPRDLWSIDIDGCDTVYKRTRAKAIEYVAAWWDVRLSEETGRPLDIYARRRAELAGVID